MKRIIFVLVLFLFSLSFAYADSDNPQGMMGDSNQMGMDDDSGMGMELREGNYFNEDGQHMVVNMEHNRLQLTVGEHTANCTLNLTQEQIQNRTRLMAELSNGKNAEIKIMPNVASEKALEQLRLRVCNENCTIELKEVGSGSQVRAAYEIQTQKQAKVLGLFKTQMRLQAQIDAENGEVIRVNRPWWSFLASEEDSS